MICTLNNNSSNLLVSTLNIPLLDMLFNLKLGVKQIFGLFCRYCERARHQFPACRFRDWSMEQKAITQVYIEATTHVYKEALYI